MVAAIVIVIAERRTARSAQPQGPSALPAVADQRDVVRMGIGNTLVAGLLQSPLHRVLSSSTDLIRYTGRRSGRQRVTPTQYTRSGDDVIILVGRPDTKTWWRNFRTDGDIDVLVQRRWVPMTARAVIGAEDPDTITPLLDAYLKRFPRVARSLGEETNGHRARHAVIVWCRPR